MSLLLVVIVCILIFGGGFGYYGGFAANYPYGGGFGYGGSLVGIVVLILVIAFFTGAFR